jgi:RNA polymerase sigma factor (sigma-70 family)
MATRRRSPEALPPKLTAKQKEDAQRCYPIGKRLASYYARRQPPGLTRRDLLSAAGEAVVRAVCAHDPSVGRIERYVWVTVRWRLKNLIRAAAIDLGLRPRDTTPSDQVADAGSRGLDDYAHVVKDPGNIWEDSAEDFARQYTDVSGDGATAWATGGSGHLWRRRSDDGMALRAEYVRGIKILHDEVARLKPAHATILELRFFREMTIDEVAKEAGVSGDTVTRMIGEAIPTLRARLEARGIKDLSLLEGR